MTSFTDASGLKIGTSIHSYTKRLTDSDGEIGNRDRLVRLETTAAGSYTLSLGTGRDGQVVDVVMMEANTGTYVTSGLSEELTFEAAGDSAQLIYDVTSGWRGKSTTGGGSGGGSTVPIREDWGDIAVPSGSWTTIYQEPIAVGESVGRIYELRGVLTANPGLEFLAEIKLVVTRTNLALRTGESVDVARTSGLIRFRVRDDGVSWRIEARYTGSIAGPINFVAYRTDVE